MEQKSLRELRIRKITHLYYSNPEVQKAIFEFAKNREICPRYFDGFGKRPDSFQYTGDVFGLVKKGATSFNCSEELWEDPLKIVTGMNEEESNELRIGWDLVLDIDCKWFDYAKLATKAIIEVLKSHGIKNIGLKFSGSKGFHIIVPWIAFPNNLAGEPTKNLFPELPRKIIKYIEFEARKKLIDILPDDFHEQFKGVEIKRGVMCLECNKIAQVFNQVEFNCDSCKISEIRKINENENKKYNCPSCRRQLKKKSEKQVYECQNCNSTSNHLDSRKKLGKFSEVIEEDLFEIMGLDVLLVSPRHLFRMPYSLHEKTSLASVVLDLEQLDNFDLKDANPNNIKIKNFMPDSQKDEAKELVIMALDWERENKIRVGESTEKITGKYADYKPIKLDNISESNFPPCLNKILQGLSDGRQRALFVLINLFRSIGMDQDELEKRIYDWNKKNNPQIKDGIIKAQLTWSYRKKPIMPPNCKEFYQGIGVCAPDDFCNIIKNPTSYVIKKTLGGGKKSEKKKSNSNPTHTKP